MLFSQSQKGNPPDDATAHRKVRPSTIILIAQIFVMHFHILLKYNGLDILIIKTSIIKVFMHKIIGKLRNYVMYL